VHVKFKVIEVLERRSLRFFHWRLWLSFRRHVRPSQARLPLHGHANVYNSFVRQSNFTVLTVLHCLDHRVHAVWLFSDR
jgi:hypothetical protein